MKTKTKIRQWGLATVTVAFSLLGITNIARADYWTRHTRDSSNNVLPQYFELENMAKSSGGTRLFYGTNRIGGVGAGADANHTRHLISYDGTNWTDRTAAAKTAGGYSDLEFYNMYQDTNDNVWMPNRKDPNRTLIRYRGASGAFDSFSATAIAQQVDPGIGSLKVNNLFTGPGGQIYAVAACDTQLYIIYYDGSSWHNSGITGGPLTAYNADGDIYGLYNSQSSSYWLYKYKSSENEYANPAGGDQGAGVWRYQDGSWTQYDSSFATASGTNFVNGVTDAFVDSSGNVWVGSRHGVFKYNGTDWINWTKDNSNLFTNRIIKIQEDSAGKIWIVALENENEQNDNGGISIYNSSDNSWDYYTSRNGEDALANATNIFLLGQGSEAWMFTGHGEEAMSAGIYTLTRDSAHTAIYGQTSGAYVDKANLSPAKKNSNSSKKVTIYKMVQKKNKKWKKSTRVYSSGSTTEWYKVLNLDTGKYRIESKARGKKKKVRTITATSGDPYRLDLR